MSGSRTSFSKYSTSGSPYFDEVELIQIEKTELLCFLRSLSLVSYGFCTFPLKAGFHMIADDRGSQKFLRSSAIIWKHTSAIACDPAIVIADDRTR